MLLARKQLKDWFLSPWPNRDLDYHFNVSIAFCTALRQGLLTQEDVYYCIRYLAGYGDRSKEIHIVRALTVLSTLADLQTDEQYARNHLPGATELEIQTKVAEMNTKSIWDEHESNDL